MRCDPLLAWLGHPLLKPVEGNFGLTYQIIRCKLPQFARPCVVVQRVPKGHEALQCEPLDESAPVRFGSRVPAQNQGDLPRFAGSEDEAPGRLVGQSHTIPSTWPRIEHIGTSGRRGVAIDAEDPVTDIRPQSRNTRHRGELCPDIRPSRSVYRRNVPGQLRVSPNSLPIGLGHIEQVEWVYVPHEPLCRIGPCPRPPIDIAVLGIENVGCVPTSCVDGVVLGDLKNMGGCGLHEFGEVFTGDGDFMEHPHVPPPSRGVIGRQQPGSIDGADDLAPRLTSDPSRDEQRPSASDVQHQFPVILADSRLGWQQRAELLFHELGERNLEGWGRRTGHAAGWSSQLHDREASESEVCRKPPLISWTGRVDHNQAAYPNRTDRPSRMYLQTVSQDRAQGVLVQTANGDWR